MHSQVRSITALDTGASTIRTARHAALAALSLLKPKITLLLTAYGLVAALVAAHLALPLERLLLFALLGFMASGGAACLNHLFERDIDRLMLRTRHRPLVQGSITPQSAALLAAVLLGTSIGLAWLTLGPAVALLFALGAAIYSGLYTLVLKRRTSQNIVIGGLAGSCGALAGWAVADPGLGTGAWLLAAIVFLWTPPHFWGLAVARDEDYRAAKVPMLPQVAGVKHSAEAMSAYAALMWIFSLALVPFTGLDIFYGLAALVLGALFTLLCLTFAQQAGKKLGMIVFKASGAYLGLLLLAMIVDLAI